MGADYAQVSLPSPWPAPRPPDRARQLLAAVLAGQPLEPAGADDDEAGPDLDPRQQAAVAAALGTPDLYLIQGPPGTGKSRVVAEIAVRAARRGRRVLLLAP